MPTGAFPSAAVAMNGDPQGAGLAPVYRPSSAAAASICSCSKAGAKSFDPVNKNGSQRGGRPMVALLPRRLKNVVGESGAELKPTITDNFILVPLPRSGDVQPAYEIVFRGDNAK